MLLSLELLRGKPRGNAHELRQQAVYAIIPCWPGEEKPFFRQIYVLWFDELRRNQKKAAIIAISAELPLLSRNMCYLELIGSFKIAVQPVHDILKDSLIICFIQDFMAHVRVQSG